VHLEKNSAHTLTYDLINDYSNLAEHLYNKVAYWWEFLKEVYSLFEYPVAFADILAGRLCYARLYLLSIPYVVILQPKSRSVL